MHGTNIMGIPMKNPLIIAPGPWSRGKLLKNALECNAGAIITETVVSEPYPDTRPRYAYDPKNGGLQNIRLYSALDLEGWLCELEKADKTSRYGSISKLIVSIMASTPSELGYIARKVEKTGVDGIEIGLACPMVEGPEIIAENPEKVYEYTKAAVRAVNIPVSVKLCATANLLSSVRAAEKAGASGISAIDTLRCILSIDTESGLPGLPTYGGYSGAPIRPIGLATVAAIVQTTKLPVAGIGGIENCENLIEYIMAGASCAGIGTQILLKGYGIIKKTLEDFSDFTSKKNISDLENIRGCALKKLKSFEEIKLELKQAELAENCTDHECQKCVMCCLQNAIRLDSGRIKIDPSLCDGCGLCLDICPDARIRLSWT